MKIKEIFTRDKFKKLLLIFSIVLTIWLVVHILALVGILLIVLYIIIWIRHHGGGGVFAILVTEK